MSPQVARGQIERIKKSILKLETLSYSHQERMEGRYDNKGYRQIVIDNYIAIYRIDKVKKIVIVVTVQYHGRNI